MRAGWEQPGEHGKVEGERQTPKKREEGSQGHAAMVNSPATPQRAVSRQASIRQASATMVAEQERTKSQAGTVPRQKVAGQRCGV